MGEQLTEFMERYLGFIERALLFVTVLVIIGICTRILLRRVVHAFAPTVKGRGTRIPDRKAQKWLALVDAFAWFFALTIAAEIQDMQNALSLLLKSAINLAFIFALVLIAGLVVYSFSKEGNELILSLIGYWRLKSAARAKGEEIAYDIGDGLTGTIDQVALLHTTFKLPDGATETRSNAFLMRHCFGMGKTTAS